jgi:hypothetical protein
VIARERGFIKSVVAAYLAPSNLPRPAEHRPYVGTTLGTDELATCSLAVRGKRLD